MNEVTLLLSRIDMGEHEAERKLLPLVYDELRRMAAEKLSHERPGQTLQATALVNEAWLRLIKSNAENAAWKQRSYFFAAAAEAMRRILVENWRRKSRLKRGGNPQREERDLEKVAAPEIREDLTALDEALNRLAMTEPEAARVVELRYFAGLTQADAAEILNLSKSSADRLWAYARAWLRRELEA